MMNFLKYIKEKKIKLLLFIFLILMSFLIGVLFENKKFYPYLELKSTYYKFNNILKERKKEKKIDNVSRFAKIDQFKKIKIDYSEKNFIETSTIKLEKNEINLKKIFPLSNELKARGGICNINNFLIVVSASGEGAIIDENNNQLIFFNLKKHFKSKKIDIDLVQDIFCHKGLNNNEIKFYVNFQVKESQIFKENNYEANFTSNVHEIIITDFQNIKSYLKFKSKKHGENWAGRILVKDKFLFISFSSRDSNKENFYETPLSQDIRYLEGKILRVNLENNKEEIYSLGHRNPQGLTLTSKGAIFSTEHGPRGGDEFNRIIKNSNYGWPLVTHGTTYDGFKAYDYINQIPGRHDGFEKPIFSWTPGIGISNLIEVINFDPRWDYDILISSLKNMSLYRIRLNRDNLIFAERIWIGNRVRDVSINSKGTIYLWTDSKKIIKLKKNIDSNSRTFKTYDTNRLSICLSCHYLNSGEKPSSNLVAPSLTKIFEKEIASDEDYEYSEALKKIKGKWNSASLAKYLLNPEKFAPGTYKSYKTKNQSETMKIIDELKKLSDSGD